MPNNLFMQKAPRLMRTLMHNFGLTDFQAAGVLGNLGTECMGFQRLHEIGQPDGKGGYGWFQWTGPRRKSFFAWCQKHKLKWTSDEANEGYLLYELTTSYKSVIEHLKKTKTLNDATLVFEKEYEGAGVPNLKDRLRWAQYAMNAIDADEHRLA